MKLLQTLKSNVILLLLFYELTCTVFFVSYIHISRRIKKRSYDTYIRYIRLIAYHVHADVLFSVIICYMRYSTISFTLKMEYVSKISIFGLNMMVQSGLEKIFL